MNLKRPSVAVAMLLLAASCVVAAEAKELSAIVYRQSVLNKNDVDAYDWARFEEGIQRQGTRHSPLDAIPLNVSARFLGNPAGAPLYLMPMPLSISPVPRCGRCSVASRKGGREPQAAVNGIMRSHHQTSDVYLFHSRGSLSSTTVELTNVSHEHATWSDRHNVGAQAWMFTTQIQVFEDGTLIYRFKNNSAPLSIVLSWGKTEVSAKVDANVAAVRFDAVEDPCLSYTSCSSCVDESGCTWCGTVDQCISEGASLNICSGIDAASSRDVCGKRIDANGVAHLERTTMLPYPALYTSSVEEGQSWDSIDGATMFLNADNTSGVFGDVELPFEVPRAFPPTERTSAGSGNRMRLLSDGSTLLVLSREQSTVSLNNTQSCVPAHAIAITAPSSQRELWIGREPQVSASFRHLPAGRRESPLEWCYTRGGCGAAIVVEIDFSARCNCALKAQVVVEESGFTAIRYNVSAPGIVFNSDAYSTIGVIRNCVDDPSTHLVPAALLSQFQSPFVLLHPIAGCEACGDKRHCNYATRRCSCRPGWIGADCTVRLPLVFLLCGLLPALGVVAFLTHRRQERQQYRSLSVGPAAAVPSAESAVEPGIEVSDNAVPSAPSSNSPQIHVSGQDTNTVGEPSDEAEEMATLVNEITNLDDLDDSFDDATKKKLLTTTAEGSLPFVPLQMIGAGGFGRVYRARDTQSGKTIAVKELALGSLQPHEQQRRVRAVLHEVNAMKRLHHKNIVRCLGAHETPSHVYILMQCVSGGSLRHMLQRHGAFTTATAGDLTRQVLLGLQHIHVCGLLHRDLKCSNLLLSLHAVVKIADFGLTRHLESVNGATGTPHFMAPEVINDNGIGTHSDVWALGCCVLEMLTGETPFASTHPSHYSLWRSLRAGILPPLPPAMEENAADFVRRCLRFEPNLRPSCAELLEHKFVRSRDIQK